MTRSRWAAMGGDDAPDQPMRPARPFDRFAAIVAGPEAEIDLGEAALFIAAQARGGLEVDEWLERLETMARGCPESTVDGLLHYLFVELGFRGNREEYDDPRNSFFDQVIERRLGIPITLSLLAMEVGRRADVPLVGIGMPGHFLVRAEDQKDVLIDVFEGGRLIDRAGCEAILRRIYGAAVVVTPAMLEPVGPRAVLARILANLYQIYVTRRDASNVAWVVAMQLAIPGAGSDQLRSLLN